jgi:hypothetical protein
MSRVTVALALLAALVPASVALVGYWFKQQSDKRLALQHEQDDYRSKIDLALRATDLFGPSGDAPASSAKSAAGLLALAHLDLVDLALALIIDLWRPLASLSIPAESASDVATETAIQVINAALNTGTPDIQLEAAELLTRNAAALDITNSLHWPSSINGRWIPGLPFTAKLLIIDAMTQTALVAQPTENALRELVVRLYGVYNGDPDPRFKGLVGSLITVTIPALRMLGYRDFSGSPGHGFVTLSQMEQAADHATYDPDDFLQRRIEVRKQELAQWFASSSISSLVTAALKETKDVQQ